MQTTNSDLNTSECVMEVARIRDLVILSGKRVLGCFLKEKKK